MTKLLCAKQVKILVRFHLLCLSIYLLSPLTLTMPGTGVVRILYSAKNRESCDRDCQVKMAANAVKYT
ncbi:hypothetical protein DBB_48900 [Desulfoluna spongiiphila]|nr:hypothetical protein DBB_48900 [Desulfoluna spongiiphila]